MNSPSKPLKIFFCDLTYDTIILVSDTIPLNIGFIASYAIKKFEDKIDVKLFKFPSETIEAIKDEKPDMICLSNYSWNSNLTEHVAGIAKIANPNVITLQGGPNFPQQDVQQIKFMKIRPNTDFFAIMEGETTTTSVIKRVIESNLDRKKIFSSPIDGTVFLDPFSKDSKNPEFIKGNPSLRVKNLDDIPSPYLTGLLDSFFDRNLTPFLETNRGCPFKCSFCHTGLDYYQKIHMFSIDRIKEEIEYIARKSSKLGIHNSRSSNLQIADTNYGMYPRDREITKALLDAHIKYKWPMSIMSTTGKNNKERVIDITKMLGNMFLVDMAVQSMDENVLKNIRRDNISLEAYIDINKHLKNEGRSTKAEIIMLLPGETRETFIKGVEDVIESGVSSVCIYTLMLLEGTEFKNPDYRKKFDYKTKFRIIPLNFGEYENKLIFDYEEVAVANKDTTFKQYLELRGLALLIETLINGRPFEEFFMYLKEHNISKTGLLNLLLENMHKAPKKVKEVYDNFTRETENELWDSEEDLIKHYRKKENYDNLKKGLVGGNLIYKYKSKSLVSASAEWIDFIKDIIIKHLISRKKENKNHIINEVNTIANFCKNKLNGIFDLTINETTIINSFSFDIISWIDKEGKYSLSNYKLDNPVKFTFGFTDVQNKVREEQFDRYGHDLNGLSKIVTRISNLESHFRKIKIESDVVRDIYPLASNEEQFTRYSLAN